MPTNNLYRALTAPLYAAPAFYWQLVGIQQMITDQRKYIRAFLAESIEMYITIR